MVGIVMISEGIINWSICTDYKTDLNCGIVQTWMLKDVLVNICLTKKIVNRYIISIFGILGKYHGTQKTFANY